MERIRDECILQARCRRPLEDISGDREEEEDQEDPIRATGADGTRVRHPEEDSGQWDMERIPMGMWLDGFGFLLIIGSNVDWKYISYCEHERLCFTVIAYTETKCGN